MAKIVRTVRGTGRHKVGYRAEVANEDNWNYWAALDLWPLDAACKLISGGNPNEPTRREDIENPDPLTRLVWVNLFHTANAAIMAEKLKVQAGCVYPAEFIVWARGKGAHCPFFRPGERT